ncbi:MAG: DUF1311 domain-containing protein [Hungatella sp.]|nr:DUF1311 domain-containing protein [Hungatella sp.]
MKNKGVLISMAVVFAIGMLITKGTHHFIESNSSGSDGPGARIMTEAMETAQGGAEDSEEAGAVPAADMEQAMGKGAPAPQDMGEEESIAEKAASLMDNIPADTEEGSALSGGIAPYSLRDSVQGGESPGMPEAFEEEYVQTEPLMASITPLDPPVAVAGGETANAEFDTAKEEAEPESQSYYLKRLKDLDSQIEKSRNSQNAPGVNNSARSAASNELKLWDSELNSIYNEILERLNQERAGELVEQQRAWLKERDSAAVEAAKNSAGGSSESLEYTASLAESTRARAYELAELYKAELAD